jgi:hypothetical protein
MHPRYNVFKEQLNAVMGLARQFPLVVVDATPSLEEVRSNLISQVAALPRRHSAPRFPF